MLEYIYFVKCPGCDDEHFDFFDEAKEFAMNCISQKPIITQIEVKRNDFGECTDSCDLGTVWSWEEMMQDVPADSELTTFTKSDTFDCDDCFDQEFDNTLDTIPDNFRKPVPTNMTVEALVEEMEENEDTVECKWCEELFDKSECRYETDMGWLCHGCQEAIASRGEPLTFREGPLDEAVVTASPAKLTESPKLPDYVELEYDDMTVSIITKVYPATRWDPEDYEEEEVTKAFTYEVETEDVLVALWENFITEEDVADVPGGLDALDEDDTWREYLEAHFDALFKKYYSNLLEYFRAAAEKAATEKFQNDFAEAEEEARYGDPDRAYDEWRDSQYFNEGCEERKSFLEEFEDADTYRARLASCPECGVEQSFDHETGICINCGFNI